MNKSVLSLVYLAFFMCSPQIWAAPVLNIGTGSGATGTNVTISITTDGMSAATSWGFDLTYDSSKVAYISIQKGTATADWAVVNASIVNGNLRVGGFAGSGAAISGTGKELCKLVFQINGSSSLSAINLVDGLGGASINPGQISAAALPSKAVSPNPGNHAINQAITTLLSWSNGGGATSYDVYFGTTNPPASKGNQTGSTYNPGTLANNKTYYWRIDPKNSTGVTQGDLWTFTTASIPPAKASNPNPGNGSTISSFNPSLSWTATGATSFDVYFGTTNPPPLIGSQSAASFLPTIQTERTYYWRIDPRNSAGVTQGDVWSFTVSSAKPSKAIIFTPANGAVSQPINSILAWSNGGGATSYTVYFGTSHPPELKQTQNGTIYNPGILLNKTTYYWRIDSKNAAGTTQGDEWSFTTIGSAPTITSFKINGGADVTTTRTVTLNNICTGNPTHYMASQSPGFNNSSWHTYSTVPQFTLTSGSGIKTVYFKVKNENQESTVASDSISLSEISVLFFDDFNDNSIDTGKWTITGGPLIAETGQQLHLEENATDCYSEATTRKFTVDPSRPITITRKVKLHSENLYTHQRMAICDDTEEFVSIWYANFAGWGGAPYAEAYGIGITAGSGIYLADVLRSSMITCPWDQWFNEKVVYDPVTGIVKYSINGALMISYTCKKLPQNVAKSIKIRFSPYGWYTGHYQYMDDVQVMASKATRSLDLSGDVDFGDVVVGRTSQRTIKISNTGNTTLNVNSITYPNGFTGAWSGTISAGTSHNVTVTFSPTEQKSYGGTMTVNSDRTGGANTMVCSGRGLPVPSEVFFDDFNDNSIDGKKWTITGGPLIAETNNELHLEENVTDCYSQAKTRNILIDPTKPITITRKVKIHYGNDYVHQNMAIRDDSQEYVDIWYANFAGWGEPYGAVHGIGITAGSAIYLSSTKKSTMITGLWDQWFTEQVIYNPTSGKVDYSINGTLKISHTCKTLPQGNTKAIKLQFTPYGWWTGHYQYMADLHVYATPAKSGLDPDSWLFY